MCCVSQPKTGTHSQACHGGREEVRGWISSQEIQILKLESKSMYNLILFLYKGGDYVL
jgi:hypothetical protein